MKILFTGATGVIGREAVPKLVACGHEVSGVARNESDERWLTAVGVSPVSVDLFDGDAVRAAVEGHDTVIHFATAIPAQAAMTKRESWVMNDRLRSEATGHLVDAAIATGVERFVQQSVTFFYADGGDRWLDENAPIRPSFDVLDSALDAERHVARFTESDGSGVVLRLGRLYGPGHASGEFIDSITARKMPVIGGGGNYVSSIHLEDVATALVASLEAPAGTYNVVDDEPVTAAVYSDSLADLLGVKRPRRVPSVVGRLAVGKAVGLLTTSQRVSHDAFTDATGWRPMYRSVTDGWTHIVHGSDLRHDEAA